MEEGRQEGKKEGATPERITSTYSLLTQSPAHPPTHTNNWGTPPQELEEKENDLSVHVHPLNDMVFQKEDGGLNNTVLTHPLTWLSFYCYW